MKTKLGTALVVAALSLSSIAHARWYTGHAGAEICVPLDDIVPIWDPMYYDAGPFRTPGDYTPGDFIRHGENLGYRYELLAGGPRSKWIRYKPIGRDGRSDGELWFFSNLDLCRLTMNAIAER